MSTPNPFPPITTGFTWVDPVANTDPTLPFSASEIAGYSIGIRPDTGVAGSYPVNASVASPSATSEALSALGTVLVPGNYYAAIKALGAAGANDSAYSEEFGFSIAAPVIPTPNPPTSFAGA